MVAEIQTRHHCAATWKMPSVKWHHCEVVLFIWLLLVIPKHQPVGRQRCCSTEKGGLSEAVWWQMPQSLCWCQCPSSVPVRVAGTGGKVLECDQRDSCDTDWRLHRVQRLCLSTQLGNVWPSVGWACDSDWCCLFPPRHPGLDPVPEGTGPPWSGSNGVMGYTEL